MREPVDAAGVALQVGDHAVGLGPGEVVDVHVDRSHVAILDRRALWKEAMTPDSHARTMLPIPDRPAPGLTTYDAKDPDTPFPPIEPLHAARRRAQRRW